jgi:hypothetical protein
MANTLDNARTIGNTGSMGVKIANTTYHGPVWNSPEHADFILFNNEPVAVTWWGGSYHVIRDMYDADIRKVMQSLTYNRSMGDWHMRAQDRRLCVLGSELMKRAKSA